MYPAPGAVSAREAVLEAVWCRRRGGAQGRRCVAASAAARECGDCNSEAVLQQSPSIRVQLRRFQASSPSLMLHARQTAHAVRCTHCLRTPGQARAGVGSPPWWSIPDRFDRPSEVTVRAQFVMSHRWSAVNWTEGSHRPVCFLVVTGANCPTLSNFFTKQPRPFGLTVAARLGDAYHVSGTVQSEQ